VINGLYRNNTEKGGSPNFDPVSMVRIMFIQPLCSQVDETGKMELYSNIRFINSLDYPDRVLDAPFIEPDPGNGKRKKCDGTITIDPESPEKPVKQETEMSKKR